MASTGKKINELTALSTVTNETVLPAVFVDGSTVNSTAQKISIAQISDKVQNDMTTVLAGKQDVLTAGTNINIIDNTISASVPEGCYTETNLVAGSNITLTKDGQTGVTTIASTAAGGGTPTLTWYDTFTEGQTDITISSTSGASLVKVYRNGLLLQPTADYSISGTTLTMVIGLSVNDKVTLEVFA